MDNLIDFFSVLRRIILLGLTVYIAFSGILYLFQDQLIFFRQSIEPGRLQQINQRFPSAEEVTLDTGDNITLHGWLLNSSKEDPSPLLIYFGGNAEEVSRMIQEMEKIGEWSVLLVNYRGYGLSEGKPGEKAMINDAILLYDKFSKRNDIYAGQIAVMGRSLGTAMAVHLSAKRNIAATILISPFGSLEDVAGSNFPFMPVGLLLKHKFNLKNPAAAAVNPMLTLVASNDRIIPAHHSKKLFKAWKGEKRFRVIEHTDHNTISMGAGFWSSIKDFLHKQRLDNS